MRRRFLVPLTCLALAAGCTGSASDTSAATTTTAASSTTAAASTTVPPATTLPPETSTTAAATTTTTSATTTSSSVPSPGEVYAVEAADYCVVDTASSDELNVRSGPGTEHEVVGALAYDAIGVAGTGRAALDLQGRRWLEISDPPGWVAGWFVTPAPCSASTGLTGLAGSLGAFAPFRPVPLLGDSPRVIADHPTSLSGVYWDFNVPEQLVARLAADGFAIDPAWSADVLHTVYSYTARYADGPVYVTADAAYHVWHQVFSKLLRDTESDVLLPVLEDLVGGLVAAGRAQRERLAGTGLAEPAADVSALLEVTASLLELDVNTVDPRVAEEVDLVRLHAGFATSPTVGVEVDYSLFAPRGHYTRTPELTRYFLAMSHLGSTPFRIDDQDALRRASLLASLLEGDARLADLWTSIYETTSFLVGTADDYTPQELLGALDAADPAATLSDSALEDAAVRLRATRPIRIDAERASVRLMGSRFVIDSYVLDQLADPELPGRLEVSALDVAAGLGSDWALARQREAGVASAYPGYEERIDVLRATVGGREAGDWATTVYDAWLYALLPMWLPHPDPFPDYMQSGTWAAKAHQTGFGSYAELKHDTVLYAKQGFAEGDAPLPPAPPRHWVEPDPVPFARLAAAGELLRDGLAIRDLLAPDPAALLDHVVTMFGRFERIARDELAGRPISAADNDWLAAIGSEFEALWLASGDGSPGSSGGFAEDPDGKAPVVVDIFSNPSEALEVATGGFDTIYVLVPNDAGHFQVATGAVYAFYEFWVPRGERLTDEEWRMMLLDGRQPDRPEWLSGVLFE
jgi:hypothetical protein